jgi:hypothetical protein
MLCLFPLPYSHKNTPCTISVTGSMEQETTVVKNYSLFAFAVLFGIGVFSKLPPAF